MDKQLLNNSIQRLEDWLEKNGLAGLDPFTLQASLEKTSFYKKLGHLKVVHHLCYRVLQIFPEYLLPLLKPQPELNAKGMGLLAKAYLNLYETKNEQYYRKKAMEILTWLSENSSKQYPGYCWGYPFDWQSEIPIPVGTPSSVVTVTIGYAYLQAYRMLKDENYLPIIHGIVDFLTKQLNPVHSKHDEVCFSYTPLDDKQVINANLFVGDYLAQVGNIFGAGDWQKTARKVYNYTIRRQNPDGSFYYYGPEQEPRPALLKTLHIIDHFHTGFVLRTLQSLAEQINGKKEDPAVEKGLQYYLDYLFDGYVPKFMPGIKYPVNIHSVSEALLSLSCFRQYPQANEKLEKFLPWAIQNFQDKSGYFYYNLFPFRKVKIAYLRWGQAWMLYALTQLLKDEERNQKK